MGIRQQGNVVAYFGHDFISGKRAGPIDISVRGDQEVEVFVLILGTYTS